MAEVWTARHEELRHTVAVKFVDAALLDDPFMGAEVVERFRLEAQVAARLAQSTSHVVAVRDFGVHAGVPFLVMEYVEGSSLDDEMSRDGPIELERLAHILDQVAEAIDAAHAMGVVHRDLKPSNILLHTEGGHTTAKVADFGIAKAQNSRVLDRPRETTVGTTMGSPAFMSPEQLEGDRTIDGRSDVWSLGVVVYEALTGRMCFGGEGVQLAVNILLQAPVPASSIRPSLPRALDAWFERALAKDRSARFSSAGEAAAAFRQAMSSKPRPAPRSGRRVRTAVLACLVCSLLAAPFALAAASPPPPEHAMAIPRAPKLP